MGYHEEYGDRSASLEEKYTNYEVVGAGNERLGKVDDLFVDADDQPEYIGVRMDAASSRSTLIPVEVASVDETRRLISVPVERARAEDGPAFGESEEITPEDEEKVRAYYGLGRGSSPEVRSSYGDYYSDSRPDERATSEPGDDAVDERRDRERGESGAVGPGMRMGDTESGEFRGHAADQEGIRQSGGSDLEDEDELRIKRSEEELRAGTREREAGKMKVRKRVRTERERMYVPKRREEVSVERVPMNEEALPGEIGEEEVSIPVVEDEVVVDKRIVAKEEIRVRKDVVEDEEVVEEDVRKEEVEIDDQTERGQGLR